MRALNFLNPHQQFCFFTSCCCSSWVFDFQLPDPHCWVSFQVSNESLQIVSFISFFLILEKMMLLQHLSLPILLKHSIYPSCSPSNPYPLYSLTAFVCIYMYVYICISKYILFSLYNVICRYVFILVITEFSEHSSLKKFTIYESYKHVFVCVYNASFCLIVFRFFETRCLYIVLAVLELTRWPGWLLTKTSTWLYLSSAEIKGTTNTFILWVIMDDIICSKECI